MTITRTGFDESPLLTPYMSCNTHLAALEGRRTPVPKNAPEGPLRWKCQETQKQPPHRKILQGGCCYMLGLFSLPVFVENPAAFALSKVIPPSLWSDLAMLR